MRRLSEKQALFSKYMFTLGSKTFGNGVKSAILAKYKGNNATLRAIASENLTKANVIAEKQRIQAETEQKLDLSRESQHEKLKEAFDIAKTGKNAAAMTSAIREQNEMLGYHRDKAPNTEREAARLARMTDEERKLAELAAKLRTEVESKVKTIPFPVRERA